MASILAIVTVVSLASCILSTSTDTVRYLLAKLVPLGGEGLAVAAPGGIELDKHYTVSKLIGY